MSRGDGLDLLKPFLPGVESALEDPDVSEIMINGPGNVWLEGHGRLRSIAAPALDAAALERAAIHIARPLGLDPATTPVLDARLGDGSRVAICVPPASPHVAITIRRFGTRSFSAAQLVEQGALPEHIRHAAERTLHTRRNILVSGGTGSGKTTLLNALIARIPDDERIVAIEDTLELRIDSPNCVRFEARGLQHGAVTIRDLVRHALRHRPDHIVVGEVRGGEAADLLQALNTGHDGSLTTVHANNAESALSRLASCAMQGGGDLPVGGDVSGRGGRDRHGDPHDPRRRPALRGRSRVRPGLRRKEQRMGHRTTRPHATLKACRIRWYAVALAVLTWLAGAPVLAQTGPAQVDRVIDGDTIRVQARWGSLYRPLDRRGHARDDTPDAGRRTLRPRGRRLHHRPTRGRRGTTTPDDGRDQRPHRRPQRRARPGASRVTTIDMLRARSIRDTVTRAAGIDPEPIRSRGVTRWTAQARRALSPAARRAAFAVRNLPAGITPGRAADLMEAAAADARELKRRAGIKGWAARVGYPALVVTFYWDQEPPPNEPAVIREAIDVIRADELQAAILRGADDDGPCTIVILNTVHPLTWRTPRPAGRTPRRHLS